MLGGCATVDFDYPKQESLVLDGPVNSAIGQDIADAVAQYPEGESGFVPIWDGIEALSIRLLLAARAERSIDAQYYLVKDGITGQAFLYSLLLAADRGVRVRLLVDDMFTSGYDKGIAALSSHPNFEIRIFNPFASRSARFLDGLTSFSRVNRRMHNKSFTIDNQITLVGGRNIADEYFGAREDSNFSDLDVLGIGPVVQDISNMFDEYWNHELAAPVGAFADMPADPAAELERLRSDLADWQVEARETKYAKAVEADLSRLVDSDRGAFTWAPYKVAVDSPDKAIKTKAEEADSIVAPLADSLFAARNELLIISPYFVPRSSGIERLTELVASGVKVTVITNSLAANNQPTVHGGYAPSRKPLLKAGVKLYEFRADSSVSGSEVVAREDATATLHTKAFIVDRKELFIGSFNFDPRSANINTELGVIINAPEMAAFLADVVEQALAENTFEVILNEKGQLRWRAIDDGQEYLLAKEPQTSWGQRFMAGFYRILPIRSLL
jgi:putative cardiolipin synthase